MLRYLLKRLLLMVPTLLGITVVTFAMMELAPSDRAQIELQRQSESGGFASQAQRDEVLLQLRIRYGIVDAETHRPLPMWTRYVQWLGDAVQLRLAGPNEDERAFRRRILDAWPVTALVGFWAMVLALVLGVPLGAWLGMRAGTATDRAVSGLLFLAIGLPEFLVATLLLLFFAGAYFDWFPAGGLRSPAAPEWPWWRRILDLGWHLTLPVTALAVLPTVQITRFLRESVSRAAKAPFAVNLRATGVSRSLLTRRLLRVGMSPLATLLGSLLPFVVSGSVVIESVFSLDGIGRLAYQAVLHQEQGMVMALTVIAATVTLLALVASDIAQHLIDPRVRLA